MSAVAGLYVGTCAGEPIAVRAAGIAGVKIR